MENTDIFYQQIDEKRGMIPLISLDASIYKKNFQFGFILKNLNNFFYEGEYFIQDYPIPPQTLQLSMKWQFLD